MDWSKAKNILLVVLVLMNVFLIAEYASDYLQTNSGSSQKTENYMYSILEENNIKIDCDLPDDVGKMATLTVSYSNADTDSVADKIALVQRMNEDQRSESDYGKNADNFINACGFSSNDMVRDSVDISGDEAVVNYKNYYKGIPLEECHMQVSYKDGLISGFQRVWLKPVSEGETKIDVISPLSALLSFMSEVDTSSQVTVQGVDLVYWVTPFENGESLLYDTAFPAWRITYNDGSVKYISAIEQ